LRVPSRRVVLETQWLPHLPVYLRQGELALHGQLHGATATARSSRTRTWNVVRHHRGRREATSRRSCPRLRTRPDLRPFGLPPARVSLPPDPGLRGNRGLGGWSRSGIQGVSIDPSRALRSTYRDPPLRVWAARSTLREPRSPSDRAVPDRRLVDGPCRPSDSGSKRCSRRIGRDSEGECRRRPRHVERPMLLACRGQCVREVTGFLDSLRPG
jgi:hypothetical protein